MALLGLCSALVCPDGGMCEDRDTCCQNTAGGYGCCPLPHVSPPSRRTVSAAWPKIKHQALPLFSGSQADCCSDHLHCCYEGTVCDLVHSKCVNKTVTLPLVTRLPARRPLSAPQVNSHLLCTSSLPVDLCSKTTGPFVCLLLLSLDLGLTQKMILDIWATLN